MTVEVDKTGGDTLRPVGTGSVAAATIARPEKVDCPSSVNDTDYEDPRLQAVRHGLPAIPSDEKGTQGGLWFDKALLRVGARVPWGRRHRGRFAKVSILLSDDPPLRKFPACNILSLRVRLRICSQTKHIPPNLQKQIADETIGEKSAAGEMPCPPIKHAVYY